MSYRLEKLRNILAERELDALLVSTAENRRYLSGFHGTAGYLLISAEGLILPRISGISSKLPAKRRISKS